MNSEMLPHDTQTISFYTFCLLIECNLQLQNTFYSKATLVRCVQHGIHRTMCHLESERSGFCLGARAHQLGEPEQVT